MVVANDAIATVEDSNELGAVTRKAARGTLLSIAFRLISFVGTQWCHRRMDPRALGQANVRLELMLSSILFMGREGFRLSLTKNTSSEGTGWLAIPSTTCLSMAALLFHLHQTTSSTGNDRTDEESDYRLAGILYCAAAAIEGWAEPAVLFFLRRLSTAEKASAEGTASLVKTMAIVGALRYFQDDHPVTAFGIAQIAYAMVFFLVLYGNLLRQRVLPSLKNMLDAATLRLTVVFTTQGLLKFCLTEGDRIVMTTMTASYDQGVYAMGSNYGGLAARLIFQPLEESARLLFARLNNTNEERSDEGEDEGSIEQQRLDIRLLETAYTVLVKLVLYVGLVFSCLAVNYTQILLLLLAGRKWGDNVQAVNVLSAFCVYTAFLAWNGMTEAFCYGIASSTKDIGRLTIAHAFSGLFFALAAPLAVSRSGTVGLVAANCVTMLGRSLFSVHFAAHYFARIQKKSTITLFVSLLTQMMPPSSVLASFAVAYFGTSWSSEQMLKRMTESNIEPGSTAWFALVSQHVSVGLSVAIGIASLSYSVEKESRDRLRHLFTGHAN